MTMRRSRAREVVLQLLFQMDQNPKPMQRQDVIQFARERLLDETLLVEYCLATYDGIRTALAEIDRVISSTAENWRLHRMLPVDRNALRIAVYEMLHASDRIAPPIAINECVELARRYGSAESPAFVNGVLDKIAKTYASSAAGGESPSASERH